MTPIRRRIAERLVEAQNTAALLTTFNQVDMSAVNELREPASGNLPGQIRHQAWLDVIFREGIRLKL